jgi:glutathione synthase/RimK-type ligase-like ATP-grasp enzyme
MSDALSVAGSPGRTIGVWLDLLFLAGVGSAWRLFRAKSRLELLGQARDLIYRRIWQEAAEATGAQLTDLSPGFHLISRGQASTRVRHHVVVFDDPVTLELALDKPLVYRLLTEAEIPVPEHVICDRGEIDRALAFAEAAPGPCVVKPAATAGGAGATAGVAAPVDVLRALRYAGRDSSRVLVERQAEGPVFRLLFLDGELLDVVRNDPPRIVGDGRSSVERLILAENERRVAAMGERGLSLLRVRLDTVLALRRQGLTLRAVPAAGRAVEVQTATNDGRPEDNTTVSTPLSPELVGHARAAAEALGLRLAGVDVITTDPSRPLWETGGVVAEVNGTPGLHRHYFVEAREQATRVAVPVLEKLLRETEASPRER